MNPSSLDGAALDAPTSDFVPGFDQAQSAIVAGLLEATATLHAELVVLRTRVARLERGDRFDVVPGALVIEGRVRCAG